MTNCLKCHSSKTKKNGMGRNQSQRFLCGDCHSTFTINGKRGTYTSDFKQQVVEAYCHHQNTAQEVVQNFWISTRTLIKRKKEHQKNCSCGQMSS